MDEDLLKTIVKYISGLGIFLIALGLCFVFNGFKIMVDNNSYRDSNVKTTIYVSNTLGDNNNDGSSTSKAVKTINRALNLAKDSINSSNVEIELLYDNYEISSPLTINQEYTDGAHGHTLTIKGNGSTISGGVNINKSKTWTSVGTNIWEVDLSNYNLSSVPDFWVNGVRQEVAYEELDVEELKNTSSDNREYLPHAVAPSGGNPDEVYFLAPTSSGLNLSNLQSELNNLWFEYHWSFAFARFNLSSITLDGNNYKFVMDSGNYSRIFINNSTVYGMYQPNNSTHINNNGVNPSINAKAKKIEYTIRNAYSLLNTEGEFYYNKQTKKLYYYTSHNPNELETIIGLSDGLLKINGQASKLASNINFNNIVFRYGTSISDANLNFIGDQADILTYYNPTTGEKTDKMIASQIDIKYASNLVFDHCTFKNLGSNVMAMDSFVYNSSVTNSLFEDVGASALRIGKIPKNATTNYYDQLSRMRLDFPTNAIGSNKDKVFSVDTNNYFPVNINIVNNSFKTNGYKHINSPTIFIPYANSVTVKNNKIEDATYSGVSLGWGWHNHLSTQEIANKNGNNIIENNYFTNVMNRVVDGSAIYHLGYAGSSKNIIRGNYVNTVESERGYNGGIYLDEGSDNIEIYNNVVLNCRNWLDARLLPTTGSTIDYSTLLNTYIHDNYANSTMLDNSTANTPPATQNVVSRMGGVNSTYRNVYSNSFDKSDISNGQYTGEIVKYLLTDEGSDKRNIISDSVLTNSTVQSIISAAGYSGNVGASTGISFDIVYKSVVEGSSFKINVSPVDASVTWSSNNTAVATVDQSGNVTGVSAGNAVITASTADGKTATCEVVVTSNSQSTVSVEGVSLDKTNISINVGASTKLNATINPSNASNQSISWSSSDSSIASVDNTGKVTGVKVGEVVITVTTADGGKTATCTVTVTPVIVDVTGVTLDKSSLVLNIDESATLYATILPNTATNKNVSWSSSNPDIASVDSNGKVKGLGVGTSVITVTTEDGGFTATCTVTVKIPVSYVALNKSSLSLPVGESETLIAVVYPLNATNNNVTWTSSNGDIASVDNTGKVTALKEGETVITVITEDGRKKATCTVTVTKEIISVTGVKLNHNEISIAVGGRTILIPTILPSNATNQNVSWTSSNPSIATVNENGIIVGLSEGETTITVTTGDGGKTDTCRVTVTNSVIPVTGLNLVLDKIEVEELSTKQINYTVLPENATNKNVIMRSTNPQVATVTNTGMVSGVSIGDTTVIITTEDGLVIGSCQVTVLKRQTDNNSVIPNSINNNGVQVLENIPDTSKNNTKISIIMGILLIVIGSVVVWYNVKKQSNNYY